EQAHSPRAHAHVGDLDNGHEGDDEVTRSRWITPKQHPMSEGADHDQRARQLKSEAYFDERGPTEAWIRRDDDERRDRISDHEKPRATPDVDPQHRRGKRCRVSQEERLIDVRHDPYPSRRRSPRKGTVRRGEHEPLKDLPYDIGGQPEREQRGDRSV